MICDIIKILKKCLKYWYVFVGTIIVLIGSMFVLIRPITTYKSSCTISINCVDKKEIINDTGSLDYCHYLNNLVLDNVKEFYAGNAIEKIDNIASNLKKQNIDKVIVVSGKGAYKITGAWDYVEKALK